jgi:hypothetical protein
VEYTNTEARRDRLTWKQSNEVLLLQGFLRSRQPCFLS